MDAIVETREVDGLTVNVRYDHTPTIGPREWDNLGTFWGEHRNYFSPDRIPGFLNIFAGLTAYQNRSFATSTVWPAADGSHDLIGLPVWLYDHSGTCYRAAMENPFSCKWDSGLFGYIFVSKNAVRKEYGVDRITPAIRAKVLDVLKQEVATYSDWANGQVFGFEVLDTDGEQIDSCWGYIGEADYAMQQGIESATYAAKVAA